MMKQCYNFDKSIVLKQIFTSRKNDPKILIFVESNYVTETQRNGLTFTGFQHLLNKAKMMIVCNSDNQ